MTSLDFTHSGPHGALMPAAERRRSRLAVAVERIARMIAFVAFALALIALRYWIYLPHIHRPAG
jgi:hypothetical protein